jgi:hypothetical protein
MAVILVIRRAGVFRSAVASVHKKVHKRAKKQQQIRQKAEEMRLVSAEQEKR